MKWRRHDLYNSTGNPGFDGIERRHSQRHIGAIVVIALSSVVAFILTLGMTYIAKMQAGIDILPYFHLSDLF